VAAGAGIRFLSSGYWVTREPLPCLSGDGEILLFMDGRFAGIVLAAPLVDRRRIFGCSPSLLSASKLLASRSLRSISRRSASC
jgi:hypothetical protein